MIKRNLGAGIEKPLKVFPAIVVLGPRQAGKTTLIKQITKTLKRGTVYLDLEKSNTVAVTIN
jgi:hypothetical protein